MTVTRENGFIIERNDAGSLTRAIRVGDIATVKRTNTSASRRTWVGTSAGLGYEFACDADEMWWLIHAQEGA